MSLALLVIAVFASLCLLWAAILTIRFFVRT